MFDGVPPEQFHQFITPRNNTSLHLPFPLHTSSAANTFPTTFDPYNPSSNPPPHHQLPLLHPLHHHKDHEEEKEEISTTTLQPMNFEIESNPTQLPELHHDPWTNDEVLALLRIRSSMENWFPELTWEHVSRKLAELGYKRTAEKCKDKFEEETRYFHSNMNFNKTLEEALYQNDDADQVVATEKPSDMGPALEKEGDQNDAEKQKERKRKREEYKFEMFKGFCESIVHNMMAQQEQLHNKLLEDMMKRDQEKLTREEEWKKQEMDKMNKELELMAREQAIAGDRHANIIQFLKKFSQTAEIDHQTSPASHIAKPNPKVIKITNNPNSNPNPSSQQVPSSSTSTTPVTPIVLQEASNSVSNKDDIGRRWPKDEVLALINLRCASVSNSNNNNEETKEGNKAAPLWERISQGMMELGYKRSAKRCKEKWENINKYFRKTKDANKKRSIDSRTCPYFHQLSNLYNQGKLAPQQESHDELENPSQADSSNSHGGVQQVDRVGGEKTLMQQTSLDFDHF